jgi:MoxR-like ATPase
VNPATPLTWDLSMSKGECTVDTVQDVEVLMAAEHYVCEPDLSTVIFMALKMRRPLFLEGEPGVGKTEVAKALSRGLNRALIRLQCYEGLDVNTALYEWNYAKQILAIRLQEALGPEELRLSNIFSEDYLIKRPLLRAIQHEGEQSPVLLIDELDRADEEFEAFLLELLSDFQVTIPELGTIKARGIPIVILTSNRTRDVHEALKRRCLYHWIEYPTPEKEKQILMRKVPGLEDRLAEQICLFMERLRKDHFLKKPGIAESLDWAESLLLFHRDHLDEEIVRSTQGWLFKYRDDQQHFEGQVCSLVKEAVRESRG